MELYFKNLISTDASLEQLVDDLMRVVQGADEFVQAAGEHLPPEQKEEITHRLQRLRDACSRLRHRMVASAVKADEAVRLYPYSAVGFAFGVGLLGGVLLARKR